MIHLMFALMFSAPCSGPTQYEIDTIYGGDAEAWDRYECLADLGLIEEDGEAVATEGEIQ